MKSIGYWEDENKNRWDKEIFSLKEAEKASKEQWQSGGLDQMLISSGIRR